MSLISEFNGFYLWYYKINSTKNVYLINIKNETSLHKYLLTFFFPAEGQTIGSPKEPIYDKLCWTKLYFFLSFHRSNKLTVDNSINGIVYDKRSICQCTDEGSYNRHNIYNLVISFYMPFLFKTLCETIVLNYYILVPV